MSELPNDNDQKSVVSGLFARDASLWSNDPDTQKKILNRLGWLNVAEQMLPMVNDIYGVVDKVRHDGYQTAVLLGMGGSSLCPAVLQRIFGSGEGFLELEVLDTTDPGAIDELEKRIDLNRALFIVASKSGTTIEPLSLYKYFWKKLEGQTERPGRHFVAITDPSTALEALAKEKGFRAILSNPANIGGRYSALSYFGLFPAALIGIDIERLLKKAIDMSNRCREKNKDNPAFSLGHLMAEQALEGRDKMTLITSKQLLPIGLWIEQLVAESTGKQGKGVIPITGEGITDVRNYDRDRFFVSIRLSNDREKDLDRWRQQLKKNGFIHYNLNIDDLYDLGGQFWLWEAATAICGFALKINPFDEPNVTESKNNTNRLIDEYRKVGSLPEGDAIACSNSLSIRLGKGVREDIKDALEMEKGSLENVEDILRAYLTNKKEGSYLVFQSYLPENKETEEAMATIRKATVETLKVATMAGFGPRYLHSTGQEQKGGPASGIFVQLTYKGKPELDIPDEGYSFSILEEAQAKGDFEALEDHDLPVIGIELSSVDEHNLKALTDLYLNSISEGKRL